MTFPSVLVGRVLTDRPGFSSGGYGGAQASVVSLSSEAAVAAVRQWVYTPTVLNGVAVPVIMTVTVNFKIR